MNNVYTGNVIWAQVDANMHLRHSAYADFGAQARIALLNSLGLDFKVFQRLKIGPILFREELQYRREVSMNEQVKITTVLTKAHNNGARWSIKHELFRADGVLAAIINVDGAWMDVTQRKLTKLPDDLAQKFMELPKSDNFVAE